MGCKTQHIPQLPTDEVRFQLIPQGITDRAMIELENIYRELGEASDSIHFFGFQEEKSNKRTIRCAHILSDKLVEHILVTDTSTDGFPDLIELRVESSLSLFTKDEFYSELKPFVSTKKIVDRSDWLPIFYLYLEDLLSHLNHCFSPSPTGPCYYSVLSMTGLPSENNCRAKVKDLNGVDYELSINEIEKGNSKSEELRLILNIEIR